MPFVPSEQGGAVTFEVLVAPRAGRVRVGPVTGDRLKIAVTAPPKDGEANAAVIEAVASALGLPRRAVEILRGQSSRRKTLRVCGATAAQVTALGAPLE